MGITFSGRVAPTVAPPISVLPAPAPPPPNSDPSLDGSLRSRRNNLGNNTTSSSDKTSEGSGPGNNGQSGGPRSTRPNSRSSRWSAASAAAGTGGGCGRQGSSGAPPHGGGGKRRLSGQGRVPPAGHSKSSLPFGASGLPYQRESLDLGMSLSRTFRNAARLVSGGSVGKTNAFLVAQGPADVLDLRTAVTDRDDPDHQHQSRDTVPLTSCQLCRNEFTAIGIRTPLLLLCGHTYCSCCLEKARDAGPSSLRCGTCGVLTCIDLQAELPKNEAVLDLLTSKEYRQLAGEQAGAEKCAECESSVATLYCSECAASYCQPCAKRAHEGSKVRSRHNRIAIAQKPCPQPTCKKHPGQSCVLYCETEKQPMCVLCKFYGQHRFHKYETLGKTASQYCAALADKLDKVDKMEEELDSTAKQLWEAEQQVNCTAKKTQEILERHFEEMRKTYLTALEKREAALLFMVDKQVAIKQDMLLEFRTEIAASRARVLAAKEEASKLLKLNPVAALLLRKHTDASLDVALKQSMTTPPLSCPPEVPMILHPDITKSMLEDLDRHGGILQLPPMPSFTNIKVSTNAIQLQWEVSSDLNGSNITSDRTVTYSLHCFANQSHSLKTKAVLRQMQKPAHNTPESGFEEMVENPPPSSNELKVKFPPLLPSLVTDRRVQLVAADPNSPRKMAGSNQGKVSLALQEQEKEINSDQVQKGKMGGSKNSDKGSENSPSGVEDTNLATEVSPGKSGAASTTVSTKKPTTLNLPPLIVSKQTPNIVAGKVGSHTEGASSSAYSWSGTNLESATSEISEIATLPSTLSPTPNQGGQGGDGSTPDPFGDGKTSSTSSIDSETGSHDTEYTDLGRYNKGLAYEEIYSGDKQSFHYSGLVPGAVYYFKVRSHNAAGWGPWSDTIKCTTRKWKNK